MKSKKTNKKSKVDNYRVKRDKKAQIKMFETIAVLVIFFFLLVFGMTFYFKIQESSILEQQKKIAQLLTIQIAQKTSFLPELDCVLVGVQKENCFDKIKLENFKDITSTVQGNVDYFSVFDYSTITVNEVYPGNGTFLLYDKPKTNSGFSLTHVPVLLYDAIVDTYAFGVLEVKIYEN